MVPNTAAATRGGAKSAACAASEGLFRTESVAFLAAPNGPAFDALAAEDLFAFV